jgi:hypothetical protein
MRERCGLRIYGTKCGRAFWPLALLLFLHCAPLSGQSDTATLSGRITDPSGAVIAGVSVVATNTDSGLKVSSQTNESGIYVVLDLHPGNYTVAVEKPGFRKVELTDLAVNVQDALSRNFVLQVGPQNETITVTASEIEEHSLSPAVSTMNEQTKHTQ